MHRIIFLGTQLGKLESFIRRFSGRKPRRENRNGKLLTSRAKKKGNEGQQPRDRDPKKKTTFHRTLRSLGLAPTSEKKGTKRREEASSKTTQLKNLQASKQKHPGVWRSCKTPEPEKVKKRMAQHPERLEGKRGNVHEAKTA